MISFTPARQRANARTSWGNRGEQCWERVNHFGPSTESTGDLRLDLSEQLEAVCDACFDRRIVKCRQRRTRKIGLAEDLIKCGRFALKRLGRAKINAEQDAYEPSSPLRHLCWRFERGSRCYPPPMVEI